MISKDEFERLVADLKQKCPDEYREAVAFEQRPKPENADAFAEEVIRVICASTFTAKAAKVAVAKCLVALKEGRAASTAFRHPGKSKAIDQLWHDRKRFFEKFKHAKDVDWFESLPFIGPSTKFLAAKNCGFDFVSGDAGLARLAKDHDTTVEALCIQLGEQTGLSRAVVGCLLWEACRSGITSLTTGQLETCDSAKVPATTLRPFSPG